MRSGADLLDNLPTETNTKSTANAALDGADRAHALRDPDVCLMLRVQADEPGAFELLVQRYQRHLVGILTHLVGQVDEAEDLAQEVFLRVYRARKRYCPRSKFSTWLFTIANNLALNSLRSRWRKLAVPLDDAAGPAARERLMPDPKAGPVQRVQKRELAEQIHAALDTLGKSQRRAFVLNKFEDHSYAETAEAMGLSVKAVKSLLSRARGKLREALGGYVDSGDEADDPGPAVSEGLAA
jgi:RNA polymerase sigma-70 factor (ECF subfamily)